jgi:hypothetical protein
LRGRIFIRAKQVARKPDSILPRLFFLHSQHRACERARDDVPLRARFRTADSRENLAIFCRRVTRSTTRAFMAKSIQYFSAISPFLRFSDIVRRVGHYRATQRNEKEKRR